MSNSNSILFVRWGAVSVREAVELQSVLSEMIPGKFNILFIDPIAGLKDVNEQGQLYSASTQRWS
ncbi:hypothetical protein [Peribacillus frigoritolerans]|uniref:hypothetical protein n=1 Tax=Peribacillus frigoritolerans TaxID=450367 RepID=UPI0034400452